MTPEQIKEKYEPRIKKILEDIIESLKEETTLQVEGPYDMHDDEYRWCLFITSEGDRKENEERDETYAGIDLRFEILESEHCDGTEGGVNFGVDITDVQGHMIGGLCPYNYTDKVWVSRSDDDAVEERFCLMEQADVGEITYLLIDWYEENISKE